MSSLDLDIDKQIKKHQQKIEELEALRISHEKKLEGIKEFDDEIKRLCNNNSLTEAELYVSRSEQIEKWIVSLAKQNNPSSIYHNLAKHFSRSAARSTARSGKATKKKSTLPKPRLEVGVYEHPFTHERIEKKRRNPRQLDDWIKEHGIATVRTWKKD